MCLINIFKPLSTFLLPAPLINISNVNNCFPLKYFWYAGNQTQGSWIQKEVCHCAMLPSQPHPTPKVAWSLYLYDGMTQYRFMTSSLQMGDSSSTQVSGQSRSRHFRSDTGSMPQS